MQIYYNFFDLTKFLVKIFFFYKFNTANVVVKIGLTNFFLLMFVNHQSQIPPMTRATTNAIRNKQQPTKPLRPAAGPLSSSFKKYNNAMIPMRRTTTNPCPMKI